MRALHTADWHIGQTLNGWSREREHDVFFERLADVLDEEDSDLRVVAGMSSTTPTHRAKASVSLVGPLPSSSVGVAGSSP